MPSPPSIGDPGIERVLLMAARKAGLTIPEVMEAFGATYWSARRFVMRMIREGRLYRTTEKRRRTEMFGSGCPGGGGVVYRTTVSVSSYMYGTNHSRRRTVQMCARRRARRRGG